MAIQPIDLQTMYTSLEKVSKLTAAKQQAVQLQSAIQQEDLAKKIQEKAIAVEKTEMDNDEGLSHIKDKQEHTDSESQSSSDHKEKKDEPVEEPMQVITDPLIGQHIDVSG